MTYFSVVISCWNQENYICDAIASVKNQDFEDFECIVVDDGSTDGSIAQIRSFIRTDARFHLLTISHSGPAAARNAGINAASGKYILFLDGDDTYAPDCLSGCHDCIEKKKEPDDLVIFGIQNTYYDESGLAFRTEPTQPQRVYFADGRELASWYAANHAILLYSSSNKAYRLECLKNNELLFDESIGFGEDRIFNYDFLKFAGPIETVQKCYLNYRHINSNSLSSRFCSHYIDTALFLHEEKMKRLLSLINAADESVRNDFIRYDFEKEVGNAKEMIQNNIAKLTEDEYEEELHYLEKTVCRRRIERVALLEKEMKK